MSSCSNWRGEWLTMKDLAVIMGKSYDHIKVLHHIGHLHGISGIRIHKIANRVWFEVERETLQSLVESK